MTTDTFCVVTESQRPGLSEARRKLLVRIDRLETQLAETQKWAREMRAFHVPEHELASALKRAQSELTTAKAVYRACL